MNESGFNDKMQVKLGSCELGAPPALTLQAWQVPQQIGEESGGTGHRKQREATIRAKPPTKPPGGGRSGVFRGVS